MARARSLRWRVALAAGILGVAVAGLFCLATWLTLERMENAFLDRILADDLDYFIQEHAEHPDRPLASLASLEVFVVPIDDRQELPEPLRGLPPGTHEVLIEGREHHAAVRDEPAAGKRFVLLYDEYGIDAIEVLLVRGLAVSSLLTVLLSTWLGWAAAHRIIAPVRQLATWVAARSRPGETPEAPTAPKGDPDIQRLTEAFESSFRRVEGFLEREREFTADLSHQLRSPLAVASSSVELLLAQHDLAQPSRLILERLAAANGDLRQQIEALLFLAREALPEASAPVSVAALVEHVLEREASTAPRPAEVTFERGDDCWLPVPRAALDIVVGNLARNAFAHTQGAVVVRLDASTLTVTNHGPEVPEEVLARAFDRGFTRRDGGLGLGLAISKRVCDRLGWRLTLESQGRTTVATVDFGAGGAGGAGSSLHSPGGVEPRSRFP